MTKEDAWKELIEKYPWFIKDGNDLLYLWEPRQDVPVSLLLPKSAYSEGWDFVRSMEDIPSAYAVVFNPQAPGQIVVYGKWERQGWDANPQARHLILHLVQALKAGST